MSQRSHFEIHFSRRRHFCMLNVWWKRASANRKPSLTTLPNPYHLVEGWGKE